jgi:hypothetical protein
MSNAAQDLFEKLKTLPPQRLVEVADFVDFLKARDERLRVEASTRLGAAMARLDATDLPPMSPDEVQSEIHAARAERRGGDADRP